MCRVSCVQILYQIHIVVYERIHADCCMKQEICKCKGPCSSKKCQCKKTGRMCGHDCHPRSTVCKNRNSTPSNDMETDDPRDSDDESESAENETTSQASAVSQQSLNVPYDPEKHNEIWQNDQPFVLTSYNRKIRKCAGCEGEFGGVKFVLMHKEERAYFNPKTAKRQMDSAKPKYYHVNAGCVVPRHDYFKPSQVTAGPIVVHQLTGTDIKQMRVDGFDLAFLVVNN